MRLILLGFSLLWMSQNAIALENGTLLFVENGQNLVESYTHSTFSHVAIVIDDQVYEAAPPKIKRIPLKDWFTNIGKHNEGRGSPALVEIWKPDRPYSKTELEKMKEYLDGQVDRRYSIRGYLRKVPGDGIHCAEMCSEALEVTGRHSFEKQNFEISPGELRSLISGYQQNGSKLYVQILPENRRPVRSRWKDWWVSKGTECKWSCWETWTFCW